MNIILASDHAGFETKEYIKRHLIEQGYEVEDVGAHAHDPNDDYPAYMHAAAQKVLQSSADAIGIIFGGSGQGEAIVANRYPGIRAMVYPAPNPDLITLGREHNNANILSIGARFVSREETVAAVDMFITTSFPAEERHTRRIEQIDKESASSVATGVV